MPCEPNWDPWGGRGVAISSRMSVCTNRGSAHVEERRRGKKIKFVVYHHC